MSEDLTPQLRSGSADSTRTTTFPAELEIAGIRFIALGTLPASTLLERIGVKQANGFNGSIAILVSINPDLCVGRTSVTSRFN